MSRGCRERERGWLVDVTSCIAVGLIEHWAGSALNSYCAKSR
jgi:hypothetical protein